MYPTSPKSSQTNENNKPIKIKLNLDHRYHRLVKTAYGLL